ncbi:Coiled-coil domain-containing protein 68 [Cricetulus griseus]|uniref:Coiled-coil domain-containing protein 68 n=1 Tax=Cricetulus griseus TaxID=10029 RepID=G3I476_CRIGR|nr:Coiled-coil domain-containing protein 68 [Cricetulus griseus]
MQMAVPSICGDMLLWVANASGSLLSAMVPSEPGQTNQHCPPSCLAWNPLLQIRTTLEKVRNHMFKDEEEHGNENYLLDAEQSGNFQNGSDLTTDPNSLDFLMENMRRKDQQLLEMNRENEMLKIKLEASREAGAAALRNVAQRLFDNYQTHSEDMKKKQEDGRRLLQINSLEKEQTLKQRAENLSQLSEKLEEKHGQIIGLENRVQRMENEKKTLLERKLCLESKLLQLKSHDVHSKSCQDLQTEISILQEQICHLQFVIHSQHQSLHSLIEEMEGLKNTLKEQDKNIENLKEKVNILEAQVRRESVLSVSLLVHVWLCVHKCVPACK